VLSYDACRRVLGFLSSVLCMMFDHAVIMKSCICCLDCINIFLYLNYFQLKAFVADKTAMFYAKTYSSNKIWFFCSDH